MKSGPSWRAGVIVAAQCVALCACDNEEIRAYRAPKQPTKPAAPAKDAPAVPPGSHVVWTVPQGWESVASDQSMRLATFKPGPNMPEVTLSAFPGDSGGL